METHSCLRTGPCLGERACGGDLAAEAVEPSLALPITASETLSQEPGPL